MGSGPLGFGILPDFRAKGPPFPETITRNNIVFHLSQTRRGRDAASLEATYARREGFYVRLHEHPKGSGNYGIYTAEKH